MCITVIWSFRSSNNNVDKLMRVEVGFFNYLFFLRRRKERLIFENFLKRLVILSNLFIRSRRWNGEKSREDRCNGVCAQCLRSIPEMRNRSENKKWDGWRGMKRDEDFVQESKRMRQVEQDRGC